MDYKIEIAPQGWQCPICKRVYSPTTAMCFYCGEAGATKTSATTNYNFVPDNDNATSFSSVRISPACVFPWDKKIVGEEDKE